MADEGLKNISRFVAHAAEKEHTVLRLNTRELWTPGGLLRARRHRPDIIHYVTGPTIRSLLVLAAYRRIMPGTRTVVSAVRPYLGRAARRAVRFLGPDLFLGQSERWEALFADAGVATRFVPNGVDLERFKPLDGGSVAEVRRKYGLPVDRTLLLHVGHLRRNRGLEHLIRLQAGGIQTVLVASTAMPADEALRRELVAAGCIVLHQYLDRIEEVYGACDCYVFPVVDRPPEQFPESYNEIGVIDTPLSVLEAMSCGLPVVATPFGALPRMFGQVSGLWFAPPSDFPAAVRTALERSSQKAAVDTRAAVTPYRQEEVERLISLSYEALARSGAASSIP